MTTTITIDYSIKPTTIRADRKTFDLRSLDEKGLRRIGKGRLFVIDNKKRCFFTVDSQVLDYANQLVGVVSQFERGNHETFAVSPDYYSNNLSFKYDPQAKQMEVYEVNGGNFRLQFPYKPFKEVLKKFYAELLNDFLEYYPELEENHAFQRLRT
ncbi:MAG: hypothetical protein SGI77_14220 [Pirellulaceae bacterium]|nr:hypothetical protein [Pirellulaceae bacterium]